MKNSDDKFYLTGEELVSGLKGFFLNELKRGPFKIYDMSISLFTISSSTIAVILTLYKFFGGALGGYGSFVVLCVALFVLFLSAIQAIIIIMPKYSEIGGDTELFSEYKDLMKKASSALKLWIGIWVLGAFLGVLALFLS